MSTARLTAAARRVDGTQLCPLLRHRRYEAQPHAATNALKWQLTDVGGLNLSLMLRQLTPAGTPREWKNRVACLFGSFICHSRAGNSGLALLSRISMFRARYWKYSANARSRHVGGVKDQLHRRLLAFHDPDTSTHRDLAPAVNDYANGQLFSRTAMD